MDTLTVFPSFPPDGEWDYCFDANDMNHVKTGVFTADDRGVVFLAHNTFTTVVDGPCVRQHSCRSLEPPAIFRRHVRIPSMRHDFGYWDPMENRAVCGHCLVAFEAPHNDTCIPH